MEKLKNIINQTFARYFILLTILIFPRASLAIPVILYNDLEKESEGRLIEVDEVETTEVKKIRYRLRIYPSQEKEIARGSVIRFSLSRVFPAHKVKYDVRCPENGDSVRITLQEIHENRMGGDCRLARYGHWSRRTGSQWTEVKSQSNASKPKITETKEVPAENGLPSR